ncbi:MAG: hypothetical protein ACLP9L_32565 [Thermoguttaceae bacterium]
MRRKTRSVASVWQRMAAGALALTLLFPSISLAQMVTGAGMEDFAKVFGLEGTRAKGWKVFETACSVPANVLWPGDEATFTFRIENGGDAVRGPAKVRVIHYGTCGRPGDVWKPRVFKIGDLADVAIDVDLPAQGAGIVRVTPAIPATFGAYGLVLDLGGRGKAFAATCVRVPAADSGRVQFPTYALDLPWPHEMSIEVFRLFKRLGVKGARTEGGYGSLGEAHVDWAMENDLTLMLTVGCASTPDVQQPLGRGRPWLRDNDAMIQGVKEDLAWLPSFDNEFERYLKKVLVQHGWPKGPINAVELWNEPWEGVSISGWGADCLRFREIYLHMANAVLAARKEAGVQVLIGGACSSTNTRDKLFCDGTDRFLPILDFVSIHYQPLAADPAIEPKWMNRKSEYGPVQVWDTESWVANSEDRVAAVIATMRAMGQDRTAGIYGGNVYESQKHRIDGREVAVVQAWAPAAGVAAVQKFIGQRRFRELLFKNGLPWVMVFEGLQSAEDGTVVVVGDLGDAYDKNRSLFRSVRVAKDARMTLADGDGKLRLYDFYANPIASRNGKIVVPLNGLGYFLRTDRSPGSFARLQKELADARIDGYAPVEIIASDLTAPIQRGPALKLRLTNVLNRPVQGKTSVKLDDLKLDSSERLVSLAANETSEVVFHVIGGRSVAANQYQLSVKFDAGTDGAALHEEGLRVNFIAKRKIEVDGRLDDWKNVVPQIVDQSQRIGRSLTEAAYLPFRRVETSNNRGAATAWLAHDNENFYFAARVSGFSDKSSGLPRFETLDADQYFYPQKVTDGGKVLTWPADVRRYSYRKDPDLPSGNGHYNIQIALNVVPPNQKPMLTHPAGTMPRFMSYMDTDYEFALNPVAEKFGGGTEIFCLQKPGAPRKHFFPRQPKAPLDGGPVKNGKLVIRGDGDGCIFECAIPWSELPLVKQRLDAGETIKFSYRVNNGPSAYELAVGRSVSKDNPLAFHNDWSTHWANELEFGAEK